MPILRHEDLAILLGVSLETVGAIYAHFADQRQPLPLHGEIQDVVTKLVSHKTGG
jgi:hypothetical protein